MFNQNRKNYKYTLWATIRISSWCDYRINQPTCLFDKSQTGHLSATALGNKNLSSLLEIMTSNDKTLIWWWSYSWLLIIPLFAYIIQVENFFTPAESKAFVKAAESIGFVHQGSRGPAYGEAYRDNDRLSMHDPDLADAMWRAGLNKLFSDIKIRGKVAVGLNPNIRVYRLGLFSS